MSVKRPAEDMPNMRYTRIKLASPSPERTSDSETESIHSYQGYKTDLVKDTSDTSSPSTSHHYNIEYEVTEVEDEKLTYYLSDESDKIPINVVVNASYSPVSDSDKGLLGDTSEENSTTPTSNSDVDPELPRSDYVDFEKCLLCQTDQKDISYPYCSTCFSWKKSIFPNRPKRKRKIKRKDIKENKGKIKSIDEAEHINDGNCDDSGVGSSEAQTSEDVVDGPSTSLSSSSHNTSNQPCRICFANLENGLFLHSDSAHLYGCYSCANKIWIANRGCPICRKKVYKICKLF